MTAPTTAPTARASARAPRSVNATYLKYELLRLVRNRQNMVFSLVIPLVIFLAIAAPNRHQNINGKGQPVLLFPAFYLGGMICFGTMAAVIGGGARIALERQVGWNRQLRLTPLSPTTYLRVKVLTSYVIAILTMIIVTAAALAIGTRPHVGPYLAGAGLVLVALIPFAALGVMIGHLIKGDTMGPVMGLGVSGFAILGGAYFPIGTHGTFYDIVRLIPSFWLVQAGRRSVGGMHWTLEAWLVIVVWAVVLGAGAVWAYRRDTSRA